MDFVRRRRSAKPEAGRRAIGLARGRPSSPDHPGPPRGAVLGPPVLALCLQPGI